MKIRVLLLVLVVLLANTVIIEAAKSKNGKVQRARRKQKQKANRFRQKQKYQRQRQRNKNQATLFIQQNQSENQQGPSRSGKCTKYTGVNIAGADFGNQIPGSHGSTYIYPIKGGSNWQFFLSKGMNTVRLPFRWERVQRQPGGPLHGPDMDMLKDDVSTLVSGGMHVILDVHNYGRYNTGKQGTQNSSPNMIGRTVSEAQYADFCGKIGAEFKGNNKIIFGIMNEPQGFDTRVWLSAANACLKSLRAAGARQLALVPGNHWTGAHSWTRVDNAAVMGGVQDPANNFAYDIHQYFDADSSGTKSLCVSRTIGSERMKSATAWLRQNKRKAMMSEFGLGSDTTCLDALDDFLSFMEDNSDVWLGWQYWAAGPWWGGYFTSVEPSGGSSKPQMTVLERHTC